MFATVSATFSTRSHGNAGVPPSVPQPSMCPPPSAPAATAPRRRFSSPSESITVSATFSTGSYCTPASPGSHPTRSRRVRHLQHRQLLHPQTIRAQTHQNHVSATFSTGSYCTPAPALFSLAPDECPPPSAPAATAPHHPLTDEKSPAFRPLCERCVVDPLQHLWFSRMALPK